MDINEIVHVVNEKLRVSHDFDILDVLLLNKLEKEIKGMQQCLVIWSQTHKTNTLELMNGRQMQNKTKTTLGTIFFRCPIETSPGKGI